MARSRCLSHAPCRGKLRPRKMRKGSIDKYAKLKKA